MITVNHKTKTVKIKGKSGLNYNTLRAIENYGYSIIYYV
jgi:hypothetical protein